MDTRENLLFHTKELYNIFFENSNDPLSLIDPQTGKFVDCNDAFLKIYNTIPRKSIIDSTPDSLSPEYQPNGKSSKELLKEYFALALQNSEYSFEWVHYDLKGKPADINNTLYKIVLDKKIYILSKNQECRGRIQQLESALELAKERLDSAQNLAQLGSWEFDLVKEVLWWSDEIYSIFEVDKESFAPSYTSFLTFIHPQEREWLQKAYADSIANKSSYDIVHRILLQDGRIKYARERCKHYFDTDGTPLRSIGTVQDITKQILAEHAVTEEQKKFQELVESVSDWVWEVDENARYTYCSPKTTELTGYSPEELLGKTPFDFMEPPEAKRVAGLFAPIIARHLPIRSLENICIHKNGDTVILETNGSPVFDKEGNFKGYRGIDRDITRRKLAEEALVQSESTAKALINATAETAILMDRQGIVLAINKIGAQRFNANPEDIIGKNLFSYMDTEVAKSRSSHINEIFECGKEIQFRDIRKGVTYETTVYPVFNQKKEVVSIAIYSADVTEKIRLKAVDELFSTIDQQLLKGASINEILKFVCKEVCDIFTYQYVWIGTKEKDGKISVEAGAGPLKNFKNEIEKMNIRWDSDKFKNCPAATTMNTSEITLVKVSDSQDNEEWCKLTEEYNISAILSIPIILKNEIFGALTICSKHEDNLDSPDIIQRLSGITARICVSLEMAEEQQQIEHMAHYDTLTELPNRTLFLDRLDQIIARSQRYKQKFALLFIDLDYFKDVNDTFRHDVGDILLYQCAQRLSSCVRKMDVIGRMGGDEFTLVLTEIKTSANADKIAKKIIDLLHIPFKIKGHTCHIGCSIGISLYPLNGMDAQTLLKCSDSAMYEAKKERNTYRYF